MKLTLANGRYEGRLADGRLLCVLPDVFEMNRGQFPETELYNPQEWLSSVDGENCWIEDKEKRGPGRPRKTETKHHVDITLSQDILDFIDWAKSDYDSRSGFIEAWIKSHPLYEQWKSRNMPPQADGN